MLLIFILYLQFSPTITVASTAFQSQLDHESTTPPLSVAIYIVLANKS